MGKATDPLFIEAHVFVTKELGTKCSMVYGALWFYEQKRDAFAHPSLSTMARVTGMSKSSVQRAIRTLLDAGYILKVSEPSEADHMPTGYVTMKGPEHMQTL